MSLFSEFFTEKKLVGLVSVSYEDVDSDIEDYELKCKDFYRYKTIHNKKLIVFVDRKVFAEPEKFFNISITIKIEHTIKEEELETFKFSDFDIDKEIEENLEYFMPEEFDRISLLISQITSSFANHPLITPPIPMFDEIEDIKEDDTKNNA